MSDRGFIRDVNDQRVNSQLFLVYIVCRIRTGNRSCCPYYDNFVIQNKYLRHFLTQSNKDHVVLKLTQPSQADAI
jgi:hypothetical protein